MERITFIPRYLLDVRSMLLGFAIFNFISAWVLDSQIHFTCFACPWYHPWSHLNEPTILLVAALFLRTGRRWGNTLALLATGYLIGYFVNLFLLMDDPVMALIDDWKFTERNYPYLVGSWVSQYLFALIVLSWSAVSLFIRVNRDDRSV